MFQLKPEDISSLYIFYCKSFLSRISFSSNSRSSNRYDIKFNGHKEIANVTYYSFDQDTKKIYVQNLTRKAFSQKLKSKLRKEYKLYSSQEYPHILVTNLGIASILKGNTYRDFLLIVDALIKQWYEEEIA